jgi:ubiquinone/menaquinone biosynthesis C-methylase UbiE
MANRRSSKMKRVKRSTVMRSSNRQAAAADWWRDFFEPLVGEVLFVPGAKRAEAEVAQVIRQSKARPPLNVLDLACGVGRHSLVFAAKGFNVTGLDFSKPYLREARKAARKARQNIRFVHGDIRHLRQHFAAGVFDLVVSMYNSFGYFRHRRDDLKVLKEVHRTLAPGGALVLNTLNGEGVARRLEKPISIGSEPLPNVFMIDAASYDVGKKETSSRWTIVDARRPRAKVVRHSFRQNIYSHAELKRLLRAAGFQIERTWGLLEGGRRFDPRTSWSQTIVARKR